MPNGVYFRTICRKGVPIPEPTRYLWSFVYPGTTSTQTVRAYGSWLLPFFKWLNLRDIALDDLTAMDLSRYRRDLVKQIQRGPDDERGEHLHLLRKGPNSANTTIYHVTSMARRFVAWMMEPDDAEALIRRGSRTRTLRRRVLLPRLSFDDLDRFARDAVPRRRRDLKRHLSQEELNACRDWIMATYAFSPDLQVRNRTLFELLWDGALRKGALLGMRVADISLTDGTIHVSFVEDAYRAAWYGKRANHRAVKTREYVATVSDATIGWLDRYRQDARPVEALALKHGIFFCEHGPSGLDRGEPLSVDTLEWLFEAMSRSIEGGGVGFHVTPHMLRHTWATMALQSGIPLETIKHQLGHASVMTTEEYTHVMPEEARETLNLWRRSSAFRDGGEAV